MNVMIIIIEFYADQQQLQLFTESRRPTFPNYQRWKYISCVSNVPWRSRIIVTKLTDIWAGSKITEVTEAQPVMAIVRVRSNVFTVFQRARKYLFATKNIRVSKNEKRANKDKMNKSVNSIGLLI